MITRNGKQKIVHGSLPLCFRLLNSEIGNDPRTRVDRYARMEKGFRLLNSEIGNDLKSQAHQRKRKNSSFRLLNSEIGNDHDERRINV